MMMYASIGQAVSYLLITILLRYNELPGYSGSKQVASASVAFFFTYYIFFGIGFQGVPWLYPTEINSLSMRTKGAALGTASNWAFNFMVVEITPIGIQSLGWKFYIIWTVLNASFVPIVYLFYPETADRTLEDVDRLFRENQDVGSLQLLFSIAIYSLMPHPLDFRFQRSRCYIRKETIGVHRARASRGQAK